MSIPVNFGKKVEILSVSDVSVKAGHDIKIAESIVYKDNQAFIMLAGHLKNSFGNGKILHIFRKLHLYQMNQESYRNTM